MPNLRQQIRDFYDAQKLSDAKVDLILSVTKEEPTAAPAKVVEFPRALIIRRMTIAAVALLFAVLVFQFRPSRPQQVSFAVLAPRLIEFLNTSPPLKESQDKAELRAWLLAKGAPADFRIPSRLAEVESVGCTVLDVQGKPAYLTCFWREQRPDGTDRDLIHLLAVRRGDFRDAPAGPVPRFQQMEGWSFASWAAGELIYTLATPAPIESLKPFLVEGLSPGERSPAHWASKGRTPAQNEAG